MHHHLAHVSSDQQDRRQHSSARGVDRQNDTRCQAT